MRLPTLPGVFLITSGAALFAVADAAQALYESDAQFTVRGFGTVGAVYNPSRHLEFVRDFSQPEGARDGWNGRPDSLIGLQLNARPAPDWEAVVQVISRYSYHDDFRPRLSWGFVKYEPNAHVALRAGRLGYDAYLEGDSRSVGYSFLPVRRPIEYYGTLELSYIDGADVEFTLPVNSSLLALKLFAGRANEEFAFPGGTYDLKGTAVVGGSLNYQSGNWRMRVGASVADLEEEIVGLEPLQQALRASGNASLADEVALSGAHIGSVSAGLAYDGRAFGALLQYARRDSDTLASADGDNGYALLSYRLGLWTPYASVAVARSDPDDSGLPAGHPLRAPVQAIIEGGTFEQRSYALGLRRDIGARAALKVQAEQVDAEKAETSYFRASDPAWDGDATVFSVTIDFIF